MEILASHPLGPQSKDIILKFIANFELERKRVWIWGKYKHIIPAVVVEALRCSHHRRDDKQLTKEWMKYYGTEAPINELGENQWYDGQAKWQNKKDKV